MKKNGAKNSTLKIPFLSDNCTTRIKRAAEKFKLPIRVVTTPGITLKNVLTSSKPLNKPQCPNLDCKCCIAMENTSRCEDSNVIYHMQCKVEACQAADIGHYDGETYRPAHCRFIEHYRSAWNPGAKSYVDKPY